MQDGIGSRREVGTPLPQPSEKVEKLFPIAVHDKHLVRRIAVKKKALAKQGEVPMQKE